MLDFSAIMIGTSNSGELAAFYSRVFEKDYDWQDNDWYALQVGSATLVIGPHSEVSGKSSEPSRLMIMLTSREHKAEFERIKALGVEVVREPEDPESDDPSKCVSTFADPDGNYFQLAPPWS